VLRREAEGIESFPSQEYQVGEQVVSAKTRAHARSQNIRNQSGHLTQCTIFDASSSELEKWEFLELHSELLASGRCKDASDEQIFPQAECGLEPEYS
jgi:hypothetical protein